MTSWPPDQLERIGSAEEIRLASRRTDGTLRPYVTMWVVRAGGNLYVRSAYGTHDVTIHLVPQPEEQ